jgi:hypothetical protein
MSWEVGDTGSLSNDKWVKKIIPGTESWTFLAVKRHIVDYMWSMKPHVMPSD